jgi:hypothetical protein
LLDAIHAIDAIDKEDEDKDEGDLGKQISKGTETLIVVVEYFGSYLEAVLQLGDDRTLGDEGKETSLHLVR